MPRYAKDTEVSVAQSRAEIEKILTRYGARQFYSGWDEKRSVIGFTAFDRQVRFHLPLPSKDEEKYRITDSGRVRRSDVAVNAAWEQDCRQRWRALALVIKAKLEAVECGITTFEEEFLAHIILPDGRTVGHHVAAPIQDAYSSGKMKPLLLTGGPS